MGLVRFVTTTGPGYNGITSKDKDTLYFISDERRIYKGEVPYSGGIFTTVAEFPETGEVNTLYVNSATGEVRYYNGTSYQTVVPATGKSITGKGDGSLATTAAVAAYVTSQIGDLNGSVLKGRVDTLEGEMDTTQGQIATINGEGDGSIKKAASDAVASAKSYTDTVAAGKANTAHTHKMADVTGLSDALAGKANTKHTHTIADVTDLQTALNGKADATAIAAEKTRAEDAEHTNATAIANETTRAKEAEQANSTAISNEITRATDAENTLSSKIDTNKADLAAIRSTRNDFYDPNTNINKYASYQNVYAQNNEYVQGMAISGNTLFIGAVPINGGVASVYRYPNFAQNAENLPSDARVVLNKSRNSHANDIEVFDGILYITDGGINNANAAKISRVDAKTFEELEPLTLWYGGITDICIVQPAPDEVPNFVYIYGSSYDTQEVYMYQAYYDFSTKQMNVCPNVMKAGQFQPYNNRQAATYYKNTRIFLYSGQNGTNNEYKASTYIISSNPAQGTQGCVATIPWTGEAEGLAIFDDQLLLNSGNSIYSVGPVINFMNQRMNYSLLNRGYETNALAHIETDCNALLNAPINIGLMYANRYRNGSAGTISMFVTIPGHGPVHLPLPLSITLSERNGIELSVSTSKYYASIQTLVTYIFYYKLTMNKYMLQFQLTSVQAFTLTNNTTYNEYKNYADIPEGIKPTTVYIDYQDAN